MNISPVSAEHVAVCADIVHNSFATIAEQFNLTAEDFPANVGPRVGELLAKKFSLPPEIFYPFGYFHDGRQVGFVTLTRKDGGVFDMNLLVVLPEFRHFGYGKELLEFCKREAVRLGGHKIEMETLDVNKRVQKWYRENGFTYTGTKRVEGFTQLMACMEWEAIRPLSRENLPEYADVIRRSFATVADALKLTPENCRYHTAFITNERLAEKFGGEYFPFGIFADGKLVGFVSLTHENDGVYEMNDVAVLPEFRGRKFGGALVEFCKHKVAELGGSKITIEVVKENAALEDWYAAKGFVRTGTKKYEHLTITFGYMEWNKEDAA